MGLALGAYVLNPAISTHPAGGKNNQVQVNGKFGLSLSGTNPSINFVGAGANTTINTTVPIDSNGQFSVVLVGGVSYQITVHGVSTSVSYEGYCESSIYVPSGISTFTPTITCD